MILYAFISYINLSVGKNNMRVSALIFAGSYGEVYRADWNGTVSSLFDTRLNLQ